MLLPHWDQSNYEKSNNLNENKLHRYKFSNGQMFLGDLLSSLFRRNWKVFWIQIWFVPKWFPSINISCNLHFFQDFLPPLFFKTNQKWARCDRNVVFINENYCMLHTYTTFTYNPIPSKYSFFWKWNFGFLKSFQK